MRLLQKVLEAWARKRAQWASALQRISRGSGGERERKKDTGTYALMEERCFIQHSVGILSYEVAIFSKDKNPKSRLTNYHKAIHIKERWL